MSLDQDLAKLVKEAVKRELSSGRMRTNEIISGGDVTVASMGNIYLRPGVNSKAYYKDMEIGSGDGDGTIDGSGTAGYIPKFSDADTLANSLLSESGTTMSINGSLDINKSGGIGLFSMYNTGVLKFEMYPFSGSSVNDVLIDAKTGALCLRSGGSLIYPYGNYDLGNSSNYWKDIYLNSKLVLSATDTYITHTAGAIEIATNSAVKLTVADTLITAAVNLSIAKSNPLLTIKATDASSPVLDFRDSSNNVDAQIYTSAAGALVIENTGGATSIVNTVSTIDINAKTILYCDINSVVKTELDSTTLYLYVNLEPNTDSTYDIGHASYFFRDLYADKHIVGATDVYIALSGGNMDLCTGSAWRVAVTDTYVDFSVPITPSVTDSKDIGTSSYYWNNAYIKTLYIDDGSTKVDNNTGNMRFTVATGKVFEFVVS